jgi:hypothetical protein
LRDRVGLIEVLSKDLLSSSIYHFLRTRDSLTETAHTEVRREMYSKGGQFDKNAYDKATSDLHSLKINITKQHDLAYETMKENGYSDFRVGLLNIDVKTLGDIRFALGVADMRSEELRYSHDLKSGVARIAEKFGLKAGDVTRNPVVAPSQDQYKGMSQ